MLGVAGDEAVRDQRRDVLEDVAGDVANRPAYIKGSRLDLAGESGGGRRGG